MKNKGMVYPVILRRHHFPLNCNFCLLLFIPAPLNEHKTCLCSVHWLRLSFDKWKRWFLALNLYRRMPAVSRSKIDFEVSDLALIEFQLRRMRKQPMPTLWQRHHCDESSPLYYNNPVLWIFYYNEIPRQNRHGWQWTKSHLIWNWVMSSSQALKNVYELQIHCSRTRDFLLVTSYSLCCRMRNGEYSDQSIFIPAIRYWISLKRE